MMWSDTDLDTVKEVRMTVAQLIQELQKYGPTLIVGPFYDYEVTGEQGIELWDDNKCVHTILTLRK